MSRAKPLLHAIVHSLIIMKMNEVENDKRMEEENKMEKRNKMKQEE
jgi:hypothetical protein